MSNKESNQTLNIYQKLIEVRKQALYIKKDESGYNFKYATGADLLAILRPKMDEMGLLLVPNMEAFELVPIKRAKGETEALKVVISYTWINADKPDEKITTSYTYFEDKMSGCQGIGSLQTYAERYFLFKFFQVATDKDDPEKYYAKHGLTPDVEIISSEQKKPPEHSTKEDVQPSPQVDYTKTIEECTLIAKELWDLMFDGKPAHEFSKEMPYYLEWWQKTRTSRDIRDSFGSVMSNRNRFVEAMSKWYKENQHDVDEQLWILAMKRERELKEESVA